MGAAKLKPMPDVSDASDASGAMAATELTQAPADAPSAPELIAARALVVRAAIENVPSPCISICRMNTVTGLCEGCFRTLDEISQWGKADDQAKRALWLLIEQRAEESFL